MPSHRHRTLGIRRSAACVGCRHARVAVRLHVRLPGPNPRSAQSPHSQLPWRPLLAASKRKKPCSACPSCRSVLRQRGGKAAERLLEGRQRSAAQRSATFDPATCSPPAVPPPPSCTHGCAALSCFWLTLTLIAGAHMRWPLYASSGTCCGSIVPSMKPCRRAPTRAGGRRGARGGRERARGGTQQAEPLALLP